MSVVWEIVNLAFWAAVALGIATGVRAWIRSSGDAAPTPQILAVAAVLAYFILGWTQGNKMADVRLAEPVNWPVELRIIGSIPGVGEGACWEPDAEPGFYGPEDEEVTEEEARESNEAALACIEGARRDNRDYTKQWANWMSVFLLGTAGVAIYHDRWRRRRQSSSASEGSG